MTPAQAFKVIAPNTKAIVRCPLCQRLMLRSEQACATCGAPASPECPRGGSEPDENELREELEKVRPVEPWRVTLDGPPVYSAWPYEPTEWMNDWKKER